MPEPVIVVTDLDGSLLNEDDYQYDGAAGAIVSLRQRDIPLVLASSKTLAEMRPLADELQTGAPIIFENGGGIAWNADSVDLPAGSRDALLSVLDEARDAGFAFRSFRDLGADGVVDATGLTQPAAALALQRQATEPLLWDDSEERYQRFVQLLTDRKLKIVRGGRFHHVSGPIDKAAAMGRVIEHYETSLGTRPHIIAIGDSPNDAAMLLAADTAILVPGAEGVKFDLGRGDAVVAPQSGSRGWGEAVMMVLHRLGEGREEFNAETRSRRDAEQMQD